MVPRSFEYHAPSTLEEATGLLREHAGDVKVLAGGMSLIPLMKLRLASPGHVVDINRINGLGYIRLDEDGKSLLIGALTTHHDLESSPLVRRQVPLIAEAAALIGDPQVRNQGTIGGALAHCDPSGDWGATMLALRGSIEVVGPAGERIIAIDDFLVDTFTTSLKEDELVTQVSVRLPPEKRSGGAYMKLERKAGDFAIVGVAAQLSIDTRDGVEHCTQAGIGLTAVGAKNLRATEAERTLLGKKLTKETVAEAAATAAKECDPADDPLRGSAKYKRDMVAVYTRRALENALARARE